MSAGDKRLDDAGLKALLERVALGDEEAFAALYRQLHRRVFGLCRYLLGSESEAEDAANDVFARLKKAMTTYDSTQPFPRWLLSVTSNYCMDLLRRRRIEQRLFEPPEEEPREFAAEGPSPLEEVMSAEARSSVRQALEALPERYRLPLALRYYSDLSYDEIAAQLGLTRANVAVLVHRAKKELRRKLEAPYPAGAKSGRSPAADV